MTHSPIPWESSEVFLYAPGGNTPIRVADCSIPEEDLEANGITEEEDAGLLEEANTNFIMLACNHHQKLATTLCALASSAARIIEDDNKPTLVHMRQLNRDRQAAVELLDQLP